MDARYEVTYFMYASYDASYFYCVSIYRILYVKVVGAISRREAILVELFDLFTVS